jgi:hypothetical protein
MSEELSKILVGILMAIIVYSMLVIFLLSVILREIQSFFIAILSIVEKSENQDEPLNRRGDRIKNDNS